MKLTPILAAAIALSCGASSVAQAQPYQRPAAGRALPTPVFIMTAAQTDDFERQEGRLAATRSNNPQVRAFARMMVADHTRTTAGLQAAIRRDRMRVPPPPPLSGDQQRMLNQLKGLRGRNFDRTYVNQQIQVHQDALGVMQAYAQGNGDQPIRAAAAKTVPIVQHHLDMARTLQRRL